MISEKYLPLLRKLTPVLLAILLVTQLYASLLTTSVTVDEFAHLPAGVVYLKEHSFAPYHHNPPLLRMIAATPPLLFYDIDTEGLNPEANRWRLGLAFQHFNHAQYHDLFMAARIPMMLLTVLTALLIFYWTKRIAGFAPAAIAMLLFTFSPTILAHGGLVTTDAGFALAALSTFIAVTYLTEKVTWTQSILLGLILGLAQLTKFTALLLYPILIVSWILIPVFRKKKNTDSANPRGLADLSPIQRWQHLAGAILISLLVINAGYFFQGTGSTLNLLPLQHPALKTIASTPLGHLPLPLPSEYLLGFDDQYQESQGHFRTYFLGEYSHEGWPYYYLAALFFKVPLPLFLLLFITIVCVKNKLLQPSPLFFSLLAIPIFSIIAFSALTNINIGIRYLLFILPFLHIAIAHLALVASGSKKISIALGVCLLWYVGSSVMQFPHYLSYFSDVVGRSHNGHKLLADSNIDWGQDLIHLRNEMEKRKVDSVALAHFGLVDPSIYGIQYEPISPTSSSELTAISVNLLLGIDPWGQGKYVEQIKTMTPIGRAGHSIWLFEKTRNIK